MQQRQTDRTMGAKQIFTKYFLISSSWRLRGFYVMFTSTSLSFIVAHSGSYLFNHSFIEKKFGFFPSHISFFSLARAPFFSHRLYLALLFPLSFPLSSQRAHTLKCLICLSNSSYFWLQLRWMLIVLLFVRILNHLGVFMVKLSPHLIEIKLFGIRMEHLNL